MAPLCVLLALIFTVGCIPEAADQDTESDMTSLKGEVAQLKQALTSLQSQSQAQEQKYAAVLSNVLSSITSLRAEHDSTLLELASLKDQLNVSNTDFDFVKTQLNVTNADLEGVKSQLSLAEKKIISCQTELSIFRSDIGNSDVAFEVLLDTHSRIPIKNNDKLTFDNITLNTGGHYDLKSGIFTVPVSGTYLFWAHVVQAYSGTSRVMHIGISSIRGPLARGYSKVTKVLTYNAITPTVVARLNKWDRVWFQVFMLPDDAVLVGNQDSSYGGTILHRTNERK